MPNPPTPSYEQLLAENTALRDEVRTLRQQLGLDVLPGPPQPAENPFPNATITKTSSPDEKIALFMSLFRGREDVYAKRYFNQKSGAAGYVPACANEWVYGVCDKKKHKCAACPNRQLIPLSRKIIDQHLRGKQPNATDVVGVYPLLEDECCWFLAIDFDGDDWQRDIAAFRSACEELSLSAAIERSRSSNGGHAWFFFEEKIPAATARKFGSVLLTQAMARRHEIKLKSYDRLFPNQDTMPKGGFGNLIALPLQGQARKEGNSVFVDEIFSPYPDQWAFLSSVTKLTSDAVDSYINRLCANSELGVLASAQEEEAKPWEHPKPTATLSPLDFSGPVQIVKANMLHVDKTGVSQNALNRIKRLAAFRNPDFYKAQAMRLPTFGKPRIIDCSEETARYLSIPRGCEDALLALLSDANTDYFVEDKRNPGQPTTAEFNGTLRLEQQIAAEAMLQYENGILSATTAFGKTVVGAYLISKRQTNTLVLVHTSALLNQWKKSLQQFLKTECEVGQLGAAKNTLHGKIDIAIMQSLVSGDEVKDLVRDYGMVIVDECHHISAVSFESILKMASAKYVYGLTATPARADGQQPIIFMQCGPVRYRVDAKTQAEQSGIARYVVPRFTSFRKPLSLSDQEFTITKAHELLAGNAARNSMIIADIREALSQKRIPIVLAQRREHVDILVSELEMHCKNVIRLVGGASKKMTNAAMERLKSIPANEPFVIVATGKYVGEGFDEPRLDTLFLAAPVSWKGTLQQYAGRLHRDHENKNNVIVYDYIDAHVHMFENMYHKRITGYASMGYQAMGNGKANEITGAIYDGHNYLPAFENDIYAAAREIVIACPYLKKYRVNQLLQPLSAARINGTRIVVMTRPEQQALTDMLYGAGVQVIERLDAHQRFAVIDQSVVWYGSISLLGYGAKEDSVMRLDSTEIAGELIRIFKFH